jgi:Spy/CpxP family protein refolding chaperone
MRKAIVCMVSALILLSFQTAFSLEEQEKENVRKQISSLKTWQLTQDLDLSEGQAQALFPAQKTYQDRKKQLRGQREGVEAELDELLKAEKKDDKLIKEKMAQLKNIDEQTRANEDQFHKKISKILTVEQRAKYELFDKKFDTRLREIIRDIKREDTRVKIRTEVKSQESPSRPDKVAEERERKSEPKEKQTEKRDTRDESKNKKDTSAKNKEQSNSDEKRPSKEGASRESGSSKEESTRARRR